MLTSYSSCFLLKGGQAQDMTMVQDPRPFRGTAMLAPTEYLVLFLRGYLAMYLAKYLLVSLLINSLNGLEFWRKSAR